MYVSPRPRIYTPSLSPSEETHRTTATPEYSQPTYGSHDNANTDRDGVAPLLTAERLPLLEPYYRDRQYQGPGTNMGPHLPRNLAQASRYAIPYPASSDSAYTWQGDGAGSGHWGLYLPPPHPGRLGGSFADPTTESSHAFLTQIMAEVKRLAAHVTDISEKEAERNRRTEEMITRIEAIQAQMNELEGSVGGSIGTHARRLGGGSKGVANEHPLLKVRHDTTSRVLSVLKTSARGTHNVFSDVWSGGDGE
jgi:hypothetical protein